MDLEIMNILLKPM